MRAKIGIREDRTEVTPKQSIISTRFFSANDPFTENYISNTDNGYLLELKKLAQAGNSSATSSIIANPYTDILRPVSDLSGLFLNREAWLLGYSFWVIDATLDGDPNQDAASNTEFINSLVTPNDAYAQSRFRFGEIAGYWQPNGFCPSIKINGTELVSYGANKSELGDKANKGDISIGAHFPIDFKSPIPIYVGIIKRLEVRGQVWQFIEATNKYLRFPVQAEIHFLVED